MTDTLAVRPLTKEGFAPFGTVLETEGAETRLINAGTCTRFHALATVETRGEGARAIVSLFRAEPAALPVRLSMMERHPLGSQAFWPLSGGLARRGGAGRERAAGYAARLPRERQPGRLLCAERLAPPLARAQPSL